MGLAARLNIGFFCVIIAVVVTNAAAQVVGDRHYALQQAQHVLGPTIQELSELTRKVQEANQKHAGELIKDSAFLSAYNSKDKGGVGNAVRNYIERSGVSGYVFIVDANDKVFYSSDAPAKSGYEPLDANSEFETLLQSGKWWAGPAAPTVTQTLAIMGVVPIFSADGQKVSGLVGVCEPINSQFLTGLKEKVELTQGVRNIDLVLYSVTQGHVTAVTSGLDGTNGKPNDGGFVATLNREGLKAIKAGEFETGNRLWKQFQFTDGKDRPNILAVVLATTSLPDTTQKMTVIGGQAAISGVVALIIAIFFSVSVSGRLNRSVRFLTQRARDLAAHKQNIPSLEGLSGEFVELAEVIDTAVSSPRTSVKSLQTQMSRHGDELQEKQKLVEAANSQVEAVNKQLMVQSKQLSEVSKQINYANAQSILLQQKLASVLQISTEGFLLLDPYGNILTANPTILNWTGCNEGELAGRYCFDLIRKPGEVVGSAFGTSFGSSRTAFSHFGGQPGDLIAEFYPEGVIYHRQAEKHVEVLAHLQPIVTDDQNIHGYIMVLRDKSLHSEGARLRADIITMLQDAIRAPLAVAEQKWPAVLTASSQSGNPSMGHTLVEMHSTYQNLLGIVDSLLMMHGGIVPITPVYREQVSITRLIGECLEQVAGQARNHQIMLDYKTASGLPTTGVDKEITRDVLTQLLEKMIGVTAPGGRVRVESASKGNEIRISIFSSGPALPQMEIEDMFAGFIQGKHSEDTYSSRLSMYLVRNNIERLGGRVWAESDRGTYIYFILPVQ